MKKIIAVIDIDEEKLNSALSGQGYSSFAPILEAFSDIIDFHNDAGISLDYARQVNDVNIHKFIDILDLNF